MQPYEFLIIALATWRVSSLLVDEKGPFGMLERFRYWIGVRYNDALGESYALNEFAELFTCVWCMSFWMALLVFIAHAFYPAYVFYLSLPLALSAAAIVVSKLNG